MAGYRQETLGEYGKQASDFAGQAIQGSYSPDVGLTSNAYGTLDPVTGAPKPYSAQDIVNMGGGDPNKMINVPIGQDFMAQWGALLPFLGAAGAAYLAPAAAAAPAAGAAGAGAAGGGAVSGVGAGMSAADAAAAYGSAGGITTGSAALDSALGLSGPGAALGAGTAGAAGALSGGGAQTPAAGAATPTGGSATTSAGAGTGTGAGAGIFNTGNAPLDSALNALTGKYSGLLLGAAGLGLSASKGNQPMPYQSTFGQMGEVSANYGLQQLQQAQAGQLTGPQQASLDQYIQDAKNQVRQYFASIGQYNSTERIKAEQQVDQQAQAMQMQMIQTTLNNGLSLIGAAEGPLGTVANYQLGQDQNLQRAIGNFMSGAGMMAGSQAGKTA